METLHRNPFVQQTVTNHEKQLSSDNKVSAGFSSTDRQSFVSASVLDRKSAIGGVGSDLIRGSGEAGRGGDKGDDLESDLGEYDGGEGNESVWIPPSARRDALESTQYATVSSTTGNGNGRSGDGEEQEEEGGGRLISRRILEELAQSPGKGVSNANVGASLSSKKVLKLLKNGNGMDTTDEEVGRQRGEGGVGEEESMLLQMNMMNEEELGDNEWESPTVSSRMKGKVAVKGIANNDDDDNISGDDDDDDEVDDGKDGEDVSNQGNHSKKNLKTNKKDGISIDDAVDDVNITEDTKDERRKYLIGWG